MIIIGCDCHPGLLRLQIPRREITESNDWSTVREQESGTSQRGARRYEWEWKGVGMHAGLSDCWRN